MEANKPRREDIIGGLPGYQSPYTQATPYDSPPAPGSAGPAARSPERSSALEEDQSEERKGSKSKWEPPGWWWFMCLRVWRLRMGDILHVGRGD